MSNSKMHPSFTLDWGTATPEAVSDARSLAIHILNHNLESPAALDKTVRFVVGRAHWFQRHLPAGFSQVAYFDDRGQALASDTKERLRQQLTPTVSRVSFASEGGLDGL